MDRSIIYATSEVSLQQLCLKTLIYLTVLCVNDVNV